MGRPTMDSPLSNILYQYTGDTCTSGVNRSRHIGRKFKTLPEAWFHTLIQKVRVLLKVYRKAELSGNEIKNRPSGARCLDPLIGGSDERLGSQADNGKNQSQLSTSIRYRYQEG
jgi:hypothetical protein